MDISTLHDFAIALAIGALVGIEREKTRQTDETRATSGLRTFTLLALVGALGGWLSQEWHTPWLFAVAITAAAAVIVASYVLQATRLRSARGVTTEVAGVAVCLLGGVAATGHTELAVALAIAVTAVLAFKEPMHGIVRKLGADDIGAGLKLLIATFIVLPVLPNRAIDPWEAINPYRLWWLVILISSLSLIGFVATRWLGPHRGMALTGLSGGLVSSTAVTLAFAKRSREPGGGVELGGFLSVGILLAWLVMFVRVVTEVAVVNAPLVSGILVPFAAMSVAVLVAVASLSLWVRRGVSALAPAFDSVPLSNPFSLAAATKFAAGFAIVLLVVKLVQQYMPGHGLYLVAGLAGLTDVDAITLSMADYARRSGDAAGASAAITIAAVTNTLVKAGIVIALGRGPVRTYVVASTALVLTAGTVAWLCL